jgi:DNA-binding NtrC family response regulator
MMARKVLVVSPDAGSRAQREDWLRAEGFRTVAAATFEEARKRLAVARPDVLITDIRLDGYNGLQLAIVGLRRRLTRAAVAIGASDPALSKEATYHGAAFLTEPFTREQLIDCVRVHLGMHAGRAPVEQRRKRA